MKTLDMPSFGADMATGKVVQWCIKPGQKIRKGDIVAVIETAKGLIDMEAFEDCTLLGYLVPLNEEVAVGQPIIQLVGQPTASGSNKVGEEVSEITTLQSAHSIAAITPVSELSLPEISPDTVADTTADTAADTAADAAPEHYPGILATPAARRLARQKHIRLSGLTGTGMGGAVCLKDVEEAEVLLAENPQSRASDTPNQTGYSADSMRRAIASVVSKSKREIPHYYLSSDIDLTATQRWLEKINAELTTEQRLLINAPLMCAISRALKKHSEFNGFYQHDHFSGADNVHLGLAIRLRNKGLVTPAIHHADQLDAQAMMAKLKSVAKRAKSGGLKQSELQDATITLSNIGDRGSEQIFGVIFPPQVAIIGAGKVTRKALVVEDKIEIRTVVNVSLAADHRVTDGYLGARLLNEVNRLLQNPTAFT